MLVAPSSHSPSFSGGAERQPTYRARLNRLELDPNTTACPPARRTIAKSSSPYRSVLFSQRERSSPLFLDDSPQRQTRENGEALADKRSLKLIKHWPSETLS